MKFYLILCLFFMFFFDVKNVCSINIFENLLIYNMDVGDKIIVYEYEENMNNTNMHYIAIFYKESGESFKIKSNKGEFINDDMYFPSISDDDKYITFTSRATNITEDSINSCYDVSNNDYNFCSNVYIYNLNEKRSYLIKNGNELLNGDSYVSKISGDGKSVVFESLSTNNLNFGQLKQCVFNEVNICTNIYKYNVLTNTISLVSSLGNNYGGNSNSISPSINYDGRYIVFQTTSTNLFMEYDIKKSCKNILESGEASCSHIYLYDSKDNKINLISMGSGELFNDNSGNALISDDGHIVVYDSYATNIEDKFNNVQHVVLYDLKFNRNIIISKKQNILNNRDTYLIDISNNGKYVMFYSDSTNLNSEGKKSMYIYNVNNNKISLIHNKVYNYFLFKIKDKNFYYYDNGFLCKKNDDEAPIIKENQKLYILKDSNVLLNKKIEVTDNLSEEIEVLFDNNLIFNNVGEYIIKVVAIDEFDNISNGEIKVVVIEDDKEPPVFTSINEIKVLKGTSTLNLSYYISANDKVDGNVKFYIIDEGHLNLNKSGKYKITLMSKDCSENISYKDLYIVVYENYNFKYYYEILLIIGLFAIIIFSIIRVK